MNKELMYINSQSQRALLWISIVFALVFGAGYLMTGFFPPPRPSLSAVDVTALYTVHNTRLRIGVVLALVAGGFNITWSVVVGGQMARVERGMPMWSIIQVLAGVMGSLIFMLPLLFWGVAAFNVDRDSQSTLLMHELGCLTFITPVTYFLWQTLPVLVICFGKKADATFTPFPRWMGYLTAWVIAITELGVLAQLFRTGPFAWNGLFAFWLPFTIFTVWFAALSMLLFKAIREQRAM